MFYISWRDGEEEEKKQKGQNEECSFPLIESWVNPFPIVALRMSSMWPCFETTCSLLLLV